MFTKHEDKEFLSTKSPVTSILHIRYSLQQLDQRVHITNGVNRDIFSANLTSPFSHLHGTRAEIKFASVRDTVGNEENPVFLIQFSGK